MKSALIVLLSIPIFRLVNAAVYAQEPVVNLATQGDGEGSLP